MKIPSLISSEIPFQKISLVVIPPAVNARDKRADELHSRITTLCFSPVRHAEIAFGDDVPSEDPLFQRRNAFMPVGILSGEIDSDEGEYARHAHGIRLLAIAAPWM